MVPRKGASVVLEHRLPDVPPLIRGHEAVFRGMKVPAVRDVLCLSVATWLGSAESVDLYAEETWFRPLEPDEAAQLTYVRRQDFQEPVYTQRIVPFGDAWNQMRTRLNSLRLSGENRDYAFLWSCRTADDVARAFDLRLGPPMVKELERCWAELVRAHEALLMHHATVLNWP